MKKYAIAIAIASAAIGGCDANDDLDVSERATALSGPAFYFDGELYRTFGTPTDLPQTAPSHTFDIIYGVRQCQSYNVSNAGPGSTEYNGGRWQVHRLDIEDCDAALDVADADGSGDLNNAAEVEAAIDAGEAVDLGVARSFVCPVIPLPNNG